MIQGLERLGLAHAVLDPADRPARAGLARVGASLEGGEGARA